MHFNNIHSDNMRMYFNSTDAKPECISNRECISTLHMQNKQNVFLQHFYRDNVFQHYTSKTFLERLW